MAMRKMFEHATRMEVLVAVANESLIFSCKHSNLPREP